MNLSLGLGAIALVALTVAVVMSATGAAPKARPWLYLVAGIGAGGAIGDLVARGSSGAVGIFESLSRLMFGTPLGLALAVGVAAYLVIRMRPKGGGGGKLTNALAFVFPALLAAVGMGALVSLAGDGVTTAAQAMSAFVSDLFGSLGG